MDNMSNIVKECPNCGANLMPDDRFCPSCGQKIEQAKYSFVEKKETHKSKAVIIIVIISLLVIGAALYLILNNGGNKEAVLMNNTKVEDNINQQNNKATKNNTINENPNSSNKEASETTTQPQNSLPVDTQPIEFTPVEEFNNNKYSGTELEVINIVKNAFPKAASDFPYQMYTIYYNEDNTEYSTYEWDVADCGEYFSVCIFNAYTDGMLGSAANEFEANVYLNDNPPYIEVLSNYLD